MKKNLYKKFCTYHQCSCMCDQSLSTVLLFVTLWTVACQAPLSMGFFLARILEWVAISSSRGSSWLSARTHVSWASCTAGEFITVDPPGKPSTMLSMPQIFLSLPPQSIHKMWRRKNFWKNFLEKLTLQGHVEPMFYWFRRNKNQGMKNVISSVFYFFNQKHLPNDR